MRPEFCALLAKEGSDGPGLATIVTNTLRILWTDQGSRIEMMKLIVKKLTPPPVDFQGSLAYKWYYH